MIMCIIYHVQILPLRKSPFFQACLRLAFFCAATQCIFYINVFLYIPAMGGFCQIEIMNRNRLTMEVRLSRNIQRIIQEVEPMRVSNFL